MKMDEYRARLAEIRKPAKYLAKITIEGGKKFRSKKEADRYKELLLLVQSGDIRDLRLQVRYDLHSIGGEKITRYDADFVYFDHDGKQIVEDVKGQRRGQGWDLYVLKKKWMKAEHNIDIVET